MDDFGAENYRRLFDDRRIGEFRLEFRDDLPDPIDVTPMPKKIIKPTWEDRRAQSHNAKMALVNKLRRRK